MKKKWIAGLLALCMCLSTVGFVGCGENNDTGDNGGNTEQDGNDTTTPEQDGDDTTGDNENQEGENNGDSEQGTDTNPPEQGGNNDDNQQDNENNQQGGDTTTDDTPPPDTPTPEPEITYVSVSDLVSETFGNINVDNDMTEVISAIENTRSPTSVTLIFNKTLAIDFDNEGNQLTFFADVKIADGTSKQIIKFSVPYAEEDFYNLVKDKEAVIKEVLTANGVTDASQVEENSTLHSELLSDLTALKTSYTNEMNALKATAKASITAGAIFNYDELSADALSNLGITDMNAFSYALLENKRGDGYDLVTGFTTKDDVIETYVNNPSATDINGESAFSIVTISKTGIYETQLFAYIGRNTRSLLYTKILNDSADAVCATHEALVEFSENVILYDNGSRIN